MKTKKAISVLLALLMTLMLGVTALANNPVDADGWMRVPTSPDGLQDGDLWVDFTYLLSDQMTEEEQAAALARYNAGDWSVNVAEQLIKCENGDEELNGVYNRWAEGYFLCIREIGVTWVDVHKNLAGIQVGDYYLDETVFRSVALEGFADYALPQALASYEEEFGTAPTEEQIAQIRAGLVPQMSELVDIFWNEYSYSYNPHGTLYRFQMNNVPNLIYAQWGRDALIAALDAALRIADEATVAASPWVRVAGSFNDAEEGAYYLDFEDPAFLEAAFGITEAPSAEELSMIQSGEWYADLDRGVVTGKITYPAALIGSDEDITAWTQESPELFALLKVKPVSQSDDPGTQEESESPIQRVVRKIVSFFLRLVDFFKKMFGK